MPKANPDVTLHLPQTQLNAVQTRLTDYLLQSQYAFVQSFSGGLDTTFDILASPLEHVQLALCPSTHGTSVTVTQHRSQDAALQSTYIDTLLERLVTVCRQ